VVEKSKHATVLFSTECESFEETNSGVNVTTRCQKTGEVTRWTATYLIAADGAGSQTRRSAGIDMVGPSTLAVMSNEYWRADLSRLPIAREAAGFLIVPGAPDLPRAAILNTNGRDRWLTVTQIGLTKDDRERPWTDQEFIESEDLLRLEAAQDFWRKWFGDETLHPLLAQWLYDRHGDPEQLLKTIAVRLGEPLALLPETPPVEEIASGLVSTLETLEKAQDELKESWAEQHQAVVEILRNDPALNRRSYGAGAVEKAIAAAEQLCASATPLLEPLEKQELLCADTLAQKTKKGKVTPTNPFFEAAGAYTAIQVSLRTELELLSVAFQKAARTFVQKHIEERKRAAHQLYFNDLLLRMEESLRGEPGRGFARHLRRRYPVALIDEFQDTDAVQYSIFRAIYGVQEAGTGLCLIGDPKQAIYGFRGGDIFTYLAAARDASRRYSLATNWRSGSRLVEAVRREVGISVCASLGIAGREALSILKQAGLSRYHHNLETAPSFFPKVTARAFRFAGGLTLGGPAVSGSTTGKIRCTRFSFSS